MKLQKFALGLFVVVMVFGLLYVGRSLLIPLVLAFFIWYLINTLRVFFERLHIGKRYFPSWLSLVAASLLILGALSFIVDLITRNLSQVVSQAPSYQVNLNKLLEKAWMLAGRNDSPRIEQFFAGLDLSELLSTTASTLAGFVGSAGFIIVLMFFIFLEQRFFRTKLLAFITEEDDRDETEKLLGRIDADVRTYIGVKSLVSVMTATLSYIPMKLVGLDFAEFWAVLIFILNFIPSLGSVIATLLPTLMALVQFNTLGPILSVAIGIGGVQLVVGQFLDPRLTGQSLNLSPLAIILSLTLWGSLWGIAGMFLCVPITVVVMIILSHFEATRPVAIMLSQEGKIREV
ncbi:AI-2E family transporter [bacterium]|nr:AI-2E family transporter [bacterium]